MSEMLMDVESDETVRLMTEAMCSRWSEV